MVSYVTQEGDAIDAVCWRHYGEAVRSVARVLDVNPHIAGFAQRMPRGVLITLPVVEVTSASNRVQLWD